MGREQRNLIGIGYSQQEAEKNALKDDLEYNGHGDGYGGGSAALDEILKVTQIEAPKNHGRAVLEREPSTMKPKWARRWVVQNRWSHRESSEFVHKAFEKKADAVAFAKTEAVRVHDELMVDQQYVLIEGRSPRIIVKHINGNPGKWRFDCLFRS